MEEVMTPKSVDSSVYCAQGPRYMEPTSAGVLSGTSFVFKDLFDVQGYVTGAGNPRWLATHAPAESTSPLISRLLDAGATARGRVQTDELAYSLNGQNIHYGTPVNPVAPECIPGGSSSGCAVAVAGGDVDFAIGTDTGGSVRVPASYCGIYGLRSTHGALDLTHCFPLAPSFDTAGIFGRDLLTLKAVWQVLSKLKQDDESIEVPRLYLDSRFDKLLGHQRLAELQLWCEKSGIELVQGTADIPQLDDMDALSSTFRRLQGAEIIEQHDEWFSLHIESLDPAIAERVNWSRTVSEEKRARARQKQAAFVQVLKANIEQSNAIWVIPTTPGGPPRLDTSKTELATYRSQLMGLTSIAGLAGLPQLHMPMKGVVVNNETIPCGVSLLGLPDSELSLIATAQQLGGES